MSEMSQSLNPPEQPSTVSGLEKDKNQASGNMKDTTHKGQSLEGNPNTRAGTKVYTPELLDKLDSLSLKFGLDLDTPEGYDKLVSRLTNSDSVPQTPTVSSYGTDNSVHRDLSPTTFRMPSSGTSTVKPSPNLSITPSPELHFKVEMEHKPQSKSTSTSAADSDSSAEKEILGPESINGMIDNMKSQRTGPKYILPPENIIPNAAMKCGKAMIQCRGYPEDTSGNIYVIHSALLWMHCRVQLKDLRMFKTDIIPSVLSDHHTMTTVFDWLYYQASAGLEERSTDRLCRIIVVAIQLKMSKLYTHCVKILLGRHSKHGSPFKPKEETLKLMYALTKEQHPVRTLVGFLYIWTGVPEQHSQERYRAQISNDIHICKQMLRETGNETLPDKEFGI